MIKFLTNIYLGVWFFRVAALGTLCLMLGYSFPIMFYVGLGVHATLGGASLIDLIILHSSLVKITADRKTSKIFSLGNDNEVRIPLTNESKIMVNIDIVDEVPIQQQDRDFLIKKGWSKDKDEIVRYFLKTNSRGEYHFGKLHLLLNSKIRLVKRRLSFDLSTTIATYPSVIDMKKYQLIINGSVNALKGIRKIRKIGQSSEFEQIKEYASGDDYNKINWKATGRQNKLMVNNFTDEKSQLIYCFIDKSKTMSMPFNGLSLLDYAINASLVIANTAILKNDNFGLLTFANKVEKIVKAGSKRNQLKLVLDSLYKEQEVDSDADYNNLYHVSKTILKKRSLVFLFTNFESQYALDRALPVLRNLNKSHLLVPVIFKNQELEDFHNTEVTDIKDIYLTTIAQKFASEKQLIIQKLQNHGIQTVYTAPEKLSVNVLNKYLELKSRGMI